MKPSMLVVIKSTGSIKIFPSHLYWKNKTKLVRKTGMKLKQPPTLSAATVFVHHRCKQQMSTCTISHCFHQLKKHSRRDVESHVIYFTCRHFNHLLNDY